MCAARYSPRLPKEGIVLNLNRVPAEKPRTRTAIDFSPAICYGFLTPAGAHEEVPDVPDRTRRAPPRDRPR
ncbi:hypothetical protein GMST_21880 [Geomonas silvestris]|uniref:Uncharacterized protein n=1 Tax=Geomonas silvestris TaxID=2740184 RepID=A0A6V8MJ88_9BACT|nr:hypothetical protein GMST_21880 [Geomonas silvestris]